MGDFIDEAIAAAEVRLDISHGANGGYSCVLTSRHGRMVRDITIKTGRDAPTVGNLIYHFALSAQEVSEYDDVLEWADDTGRDLNDNQTLPLFRQLVDNKRDFRLLLSEPVYQKLMAGLEISQAIGGAGRAGFV